MCALAAPPSSQRNFVACPIVRDTQTVPCWLAEYEGELYYLGVQSESATDWRPPYLGHRVLVEGTVTDAYRICGGIVLRPVVTSVISEIDPACNTVVQPALDQFTVPFARKGDRIDSPPQTQLDAAEYAVYYEFDSARLSPHNTALIERALRQAASTPIRIELLGLRGATLLSNGSILAESSGTAERRVAHVAELFVESGFQRDRIAVRWDDRIQPADGFEDFESRRLTIRLLAPASGR